MLAWIFCIQFVFIGYILDKRRRKIYSKILRMLLANHDCTDTRDRTGSRHVISI